MPFVAAPNIVEVEIRAILDGQHIENRIMIDVLTVPTATICETAAATVMGWVLAHYRDTIPAEVTFTEVVATSLATIDGAQFTATYTDATIGGVSGGSMPNEVSLCASLRSGLRGRSARGRFYALAVPRSQVVGNNADPTFVAGLVTVMTDLKTAIEAAGWLWVIVSYITEGAPRVGGPVYYTVATISYTDNIVDSQRRRKPGNGS